MTRKFVVRGATPPEDPPTEFWLEVDDDGVLDVKARVGDTEVFVLGFDPEDGGVLRYSLSATQAAALGLTRDEHAKVVVS